MATLRLTLPVLPASEGSNAMAELCVLARGRVLGALGLTTIGATSMFTVFTYISPILREETHSSLGFITAMLVLFGVGMTMGNWLGGRFANRSIDRTLVATLSSLMLILVALSLLMPFAAPTALLICLWGTASFALVPPLQIRVMQTAADAPNLASVMNIGAFNLGNAIGAAVGSGVIAVGLGYPAVALAGAAAAALGLLAVVVSSRHQALDPRASYTS